MKKTPLGNTLPRLSIAIVTYNCLDDFKLTLDNVVSQQYPNKEVVVVDGGSMDGTESYIKQKSDLIDQYLIEEDNGPYDAMNKACRIAKGEWIVFINSGDMFTSDNICEKILTKNISNYDVLYGDHLYRDASGKLYHIKSSEFDEIWNVLKSGRISNSWQASIPCHQATFTRTSLLQKTPYDLDFRIAADHDFLYKMKASGKKLHYIPEKIAIFSAGGMSQTNKWQCLFEWISITSKYANPLVIRFYYLFLNPLKGRISRM